MARANEFGLAQQLGHERDDCDHDDGDPQEAHAQHERLNGVSPDALGGRRD